MTAKVTQFRQNLFHILDQCRDTRKPVRIERGDDIPERPWAIVGDIDELHLVKTWEWDPDEEMREHGLS